MSMSALGISTTEPWAVHPDYILKGHPATRNWFFLGSPVGVVSVLAFYLYFCISLGPSIMKNRKPLSIRPIVIAYNILMVGYSVYFCALTIYYAYYLSKYSIVCQANDSYKNPVVDKLYHHGYWYMMLKVSELLDTVFFVLMKKASHISFLHLLHHTLALSTVWLDMNLGITGQVALFPILNTSVHVVMYGYYALSALPPSMRPNLWWKKYVTQFQIAQFLVLMFHALIPVFHDCQFPRIFAVMMAFEAGLFAYLFSDFYVRTYLKTDKKKINGVDESSQEIKASKNGNILASGEVYLNGKNKEL